MQRGLDFTYLSTELIPFGQTVVVAVIVRNAVERRGNHENGTHKLYLETESAQLRIISLEASEGARNGKRARTRIDKEL